MSVWSRIADWLVDEGAHYDRRFEGHTPQPPRGRLGRPLGDVHPELFRLASIEGTVWECARDFRPPARWVSFTLGEAREVERNPGSVPAWRMLVVMLGDSGFPDLALIAALRAERLVASIQDLRRLVVHRNICLWQLGLARHAAPGLVPAPELGDPRRTVLDKEAIRPWLSKQLRPFEGNLEAAADRVVEIVIAADDA